jgi:hypothetical protein
MSGRSLGTFYQNYMFFSPLPSAINSLNSPMTFLFRLLFCYTFTSPSLSLELEMVKTKYLLHVHSMKNILIIVCNVTLRSLVEVYGRF